MCRPPLGDRVQSQCVGAVADRVAVSAHALAAGVVRLAIADAQRPVGDENPLWGLVGRQGRADMRPHVRLVERLPGRELDDRGHGLAPLRVRQAHDQRIGDGGVGFRASSTSSGKTFSPVLHAGGDGGVSRRLPAGDQVVLPEVLRPDPDSRPAAGRRLPARAFDGAGEDVRRPRPALGTVAAADAALGARPAGLLQGARSSRTKSGTGVRCRRCGAG